MNKQFITGAIVVIVILLGYGVMSRSDTNNDGSDAGSREKSIITVDGSSTVFPITEAVAEDFQKTDSLVNVTVGVSGTGGGFKKFCAGETHISDASRPIKSTEADACKASNIGYIELPVAYDGLAVMVHPKNTWVDSLTVTELKKIWEPGAQGKVLKWSDVRASWPNTELHLYGPGADSGTFDYFTEAIVGKEDSSRGDFTASEDDNVLVQGISNDQGALGFFGLAYYEQNKDKLKLVPVDDGKAENGAGAILPSRETVEGGTYQPLSRPIFIYVSQAAADREDVSRFVEYYLDQATKLVPQVGYITLPGNSYERARDKFKKRTVGSAFAGGSQVGVTIDHILDAR
ncbi:MAG: protein sphX [Candidatus Andersenbacteria bacterium RIFCSPHIGHO2_02_FULL_45_11]|uniref:Phosphate-binding protein n=1 Tax=Candidatus Andersenbacteria bacterium RIFCSPHIGHO2_12_FULL_45_11 TaxID=1797281 RepID=A0A1G1X2T5_9BACT|nr:MAG: protein sphX [Candidatus Andersenbacteria bacterium RIFCSPHIGHO2_01_FULL_46_36]OGY32127.1 MAG: protein sphX [Candidatus Andersenbacteria bacterium RIFCSPHIGHO2_02_FULL_45_11]OGY34325.1 MAG: protein sphX [Candidatus Andersenbacteria bacterium RIFCSPHIGHO2_12_FULL_45_11]